MLGKQAARTEERFGASGVSIVCVLSYEGGLRRSKVIGYLCPEVQRGQLEVWLI